MSVSAAAGHARDAASPGAHACRPLDARDRPQPIDYLQEALIFRSYGWSVIPIRGKLPVGGWKAWQTRRMWDRRIGEAFRTSRPVTGLAVIFGPVSGWLTSRDFDSLESYVRWAIRHPDLAALCPTVLTKRGVHVYFRNQDREEIFRRWRDGELRGSCGQYAVLPPSEHPRGGRYRWACGVPAGVSAFPWLRLADTGFLDADRAGGRRLFPKHRKTPLADDGADKTTAGKTTAGKTTAGKTTAGKTTAGKTTAGKTTAGKITITSSVKNGRLNKETPDGPNGLELPPPRTVREAVNRCLPGAPGERHHCIFKLCRVLKGMAGLEDKAALDPDPVDAFRQWFSRALPMIRTKDWATSWKDFQDGWDRVHYPAGVSLADAVAEAPLPPEVLGYRDQPTRALFRLCVALAARSTSGVFYLSCRTAAETCGLGNHVTARSRLMQFVRAGLLEVVTPGTPSATARVATRFRVGSSTGVQLLLVQSQQVRW